MKIIALRTFSDRAAKIKHYVYEKTYNVDDKKGTSFIKNGWAEEAKGK